MFPRCLFVEALLCVHVAEIVVGGGVTRVTPDPLLKILRSFVQFTRYALMVVSRDREPFTLAGVLPQLKRLGIILARPS